MIRFGSQKYLNNNSNVIQLDLFWLHKSFFVLYYTVALLYSLAK